MDRYTVVWPKDTQDELIDLWIRSDGRNAVAAAVNAIDLHLAGDAPVQGSELSEGLRALVIPPLKDSIFGQRKRSPC
jgi:hypothetical protein